MNNTDESEKNMKSRLSGVLPALIGPIDSNGNVDEKSLVTQTQFLIDSGAHGIFVNGSTAESPHMTTQERVTSFRIVKEAVAGRVPVLAACIQPSTGLVQREIDEVAKYLPDYVVATTPYYYSVNQDAILTHFQAIAAHSPVPVVAYDIPSSTHNRIEFVTMQALPEIKNVVGLKDSSGDFVKFSRAVRSSGEGEFAWIQGDDYLDAVSFLIGASAIVTGMGNVHLAPYVDLYSSITDGLSQEHIFAHQRQIDALCSLFADTGEHPIPSIKAATSLLGRCENRMRVDGMQVSRRSVEKMDDILKSLALK